MNFDFQQLKSLLFSAKVAPSGIFGLDIGTSSVKAAQIKRKGLKKGAQISFAVAEIAEEGGKEVVVSAIKQCIQSAEINSAAVNLSFSGGNIITRYMLMPKMTPKDLVGSLEFELAKHIPTNLEDMVIDYQIIDNKSLDNQMLILVVVAERKIITERVDLVKQAGLTPHSLNVDCFAVLDAFQHFNLSNPEISSTYALLDLGHKTSKLVVLDRKNLRFSRDIPLGGFELTKAISERMNVDLAAAKKLKHNAKEKNEEQDLIINSNLSSISDEVHLSFDYCERLTQKKISELYLSGGGAQLKGINEFFSNNLEISVKTWNPLSGFILPAAFSKEEIELSCPIFATAVGLAL